MNRNQARPTVRARHAGAAAAVVFVGLACLPMQAHAKMLICAPDGRGCHYARGSCSDVTLPKNWTCTNKLVVNPRDRDRLVRGADGQVSLVLGGRTVRVLSDALEARLAREKPGAEALGRMISADRGVLAEESVRRLGKELGVPIEQAPPARR